MGAPRLRLTDEILERVIFGMENQRERLSLDPSDGMLKGEHDGGADMVPLPPWRPADGYRLMDRFVGTLPNAVFAHRLRDILNGSSGVFRQFKDALAERPEIQSLWRRFKMREMRRSALSWLSRWADALDLANLGPEPEDWEDLPISEFSVRPAAEAERVLIGTLDAAARVETGVAASKNTGASVLVAETPAGEVAGFSRIVLTEGMAGRLEQVYVLPEFRGLGVGGLLAEHGFNYARDMGAERLIITIGSSGSMLEGWLEREGFTIVAREWVKAR